MTYFRVIPPAEKHLVQRRNPSRAAEWTKPPGAILQLTIAALLALCGLGLMIAEARDGSLDIPRVSSLDREAPPTRMAFGSDLRTSPP